ncbi:pyridoxamine 5'-phosphate oxidase [Stackebrandtia nassauensis]|uniref:Pyridoxine/pyridoxamine 5'-phosphate oxidase n=1 Tax=Stackebrandtia nassauensis (strain DSM 44728 / CIP 108903 / NRRL B-16338 / NBRC 102104 / LLR-40K-21) TaxID=446470 RepID=D3QA16_STANL|nr:pyridoxamine 5'-phosphate oxidase [Stackebrandtia nassauensis]ADD40728.1 pyridoxamine 5'-phosphate oxidase [Stackebrandtia nassauensis DSM 44728]
MKRTVNAEDLSRLRREYDEPDELDLETDPFGWFRRWFDEAATVEPEPNAMVLATVDDQGFPRQRTVLLKSFDTSGFTFFTNYTSDKGVQLTANPKVNLLFGWYRLHRQVIVSGTAKRVPPEESARYFATRPRGAQLAAWASPQSRPIPGRTDLESAFAQAEARFPDEVPVPPHWGGFLVEPRLIEFWQGRRNRMHDRVRYHRESSAWVPVRLAP